MDAWEQQSKDLTARRQQWDSAQDFDFIRVLLESENEEEVKGAYIRQFLLPVKTGKKHDLTVNNVLFEFKYSVNFKNLDVAAKVVAQTIYYIHRLFEAGQEQEISHFVIADKDEAIIFKTSDFEHFYKSYAYDWKGYCPSSPDPKLTEHLKRSRIIESSRIYIMTDEDDLSIFANLLYRIVDYKKTIPKSSNNYQKNQKNRFNLIIYSLLLILILGIVSFLVIRYKSGVGNQQIPVRNHTLGK